MPDAFGMRAVAMRNERAAFKIAASAETRVADKAAILASVRRRGIDSVSIRLRAVEPKRYRNIDRIVHLIIKRAPLFIATGIE